jgi:hypothetical protein
MVSKVEHPFDLTKVRSQCQVIDTIARFSGPTDCLVQPWKDEGFRRLYRVRGLLSIEILSCRRELIPLVGSSGANSGCHAENASLFMHNLLLTALHL